MQQTKLATGYPPVFLAHNICVSYHIWLTSWKILQQSHSWCSRLSWQLATQFMKESDLKLTPTPSYWNVNCNTQLTFIDSYFDGVLLLSLTPNPSPLAVPKSYCFSSHLFFRYFLICVLVSPSGVCYLNYATRITLSSDFINQSQVAAGTGAMVASWPITGTRDRT